MTDPNSTIVDAATLVGQVVSDRYEVQSHLGDGSMGIVFLAEHTHMKKKVALKVMRPEFLDNPEAVERFEREAQATGHIDHPHVCSSSDFGRLDDARFFLVMEYLEGKTLSEVIAEDERLVPERAVKITRQIALGLQRAHELGVIHRDLKPDNIILIDREGNPDFVKITDFGVARVEVVNAQNLTRVGTTMGTPVYMSPEQAVAKRADERSDLYTLGIMLFEMLTGGVPFYSQSLAVILSMHAKDPPPSMHDVAPDALIPHDLVQIVEKLLDKNPDKRFATATDLIEALDRADLTPFVPGLGGPPLPAGPPAAAPGEAGADPLLSGIDAFSSGESLEPGDDASSTIVEPGPIGEVALPSPQKGASIGDFAARVMALPPGKRFALIFAFVSVLALPLIVALALLVSSDDEGEEFEEGAEMAFSVEDARPEDLEADRDDFIDDHDLKEKLSAAGPDASIALLTPLLAEEGADPHLHYLLGRAKSDAGNSADAMPHYQRAVEAEPRYSADGQLVTDTVKQFGAKEDEAAASAKPVLAALLTMPTAGTTRTSIYDLAVEGSWRARKRARALLEETGQFDSLEPWQRTAVELRGTGKNCEKVKKLVNELGDSGEPRALPALQKTARRPSEGCGFLNKQDCYKCMRADLKKAISTLEKAQAGAAAP